MNEWRNIQDIVRVTFKAFHDVLKAQGEAIRSLERAVEKKASQREVATALAAKASAAELEAQLFRKADTTVRTFCCTAHQRHLVLDVASVTNDVRPCQYQRCHCVPWWLHTFGHQAGLESPLARAGCQQTSAEGRRDAGIGCRSARCHGCGEQQSKRARFGGSGAAQPRPNPWSASRGVLLRDAAYWTLSLHELRQQVNTSNKVESGDLIRAIKCLRMY
jgi:hypothetical protein